MSDVPVTCMHALLCRCRFCIYNLVENEAHFVLECPITPIRDKFSSLFENVVLGSLESFFHMEHRVDVKPLSHKRYYTLSL